MVFFVIRLLSPFLTDTPQTAFASLKNCCTYTWTVLLSPLPIRALSPQWQLASMVYTLHRFKARRVYMRPCVKKLGLEK